MQIIKNIFDVKNTNLVCFCESENDLFSIDQYLNNRSKEILKENFSKGKNFVCDFFIWNENVDKIFVISYIDKTREKYAFIADSFRKTPENFTILPNSNGNIEMLLDCSVLGKYKFKKYLSEKSENETFIISDKSDIINDRLSTIENICLSRDLANTPTCDKTPEMILKYIESFSMKNTKIRVLDHDEIKKEGLNLIDAVGKASINSPKLIILERIVSSEYKTYWYVWKGVIFDTGGVNIKPSDWLYDMKMDMGWASQVIHVMKELDDKELNVNIIAAIPLVENSLSSNAYRPSDIIKAYNWKTVDIINTDAEWRLILADSVSYISDKYNLSTIITTATLTWACMHALGFNYTAVMWNSRQIIDKLVVESRQKEEKYLELPFGEYYIDWTKWEISDLANHTPWKFAWSSFAWAFIANFCDNWESFVHLDIAWTSDRKDDYSIFPKWATWIGVDSISKFFRSL